MRFKGFPSLLAIGLSLVAPGVSLAQLAPYQVIHTMSGTDGASPQSGLVRGADNQLYGTATSSLIDHDSDPDTDPIPDPARAGTIYRILSNGTFEIVHTFQRSTPQFGLDPVSLIRGRDKNLYGTAEYGGRLSDGSAVDAGGNPVGDGVIYRLNWNATTGTYGPGITILHTFDCSKGEGGDPWGSMVEGPDGALYGVTAPSDWPDGNCTDPTTVYKINKDGTGFKVLAGFDYLATGGWQFGPLVFGSDGSIFGTLSKSGNAAFQYGSVFKISPDAIPVVTYPKIFGAADAALLDGAYPYSGLVRGMDGAFYGTTSEGGTGGVGTIFRIDEDGNFTSLYSFDPLSINLPYSSLVVGGDGKLYGAAHAGGSANAGGSYILDPPAPIGSGGGFTLHSVFDHFTTGSSPWGPLGVGADRHLYGTQSGGGEFDQGTLFGLLNIDVVNRPPVAYVIATPNPAEATTPAGATVSLSALGSWDADFDDLTYSWTLPSGATLISEAPDHSTLVARFPLVPPTHNVTLNVSDGVSTRAVTKTITVFDAPPILSPVVAIAQVAATTAGTVVTYTPPTATDVVDGTVPVTCIPPSGSTFAVGSTTVVCTAIDSANNEETTSFVVTVTLDTTPPVLTLPLGILTEATGPSGATVTYNVTASDNLGVPTVSCSPPSGSVFAIATTTVECAATDSTGLTTEGSFTVHVMDTTGPVITVPANIVVVTTNLTGTNVTYPAVTAFDAVDLGRDVTCDHASGSFFSVGTTTVTCKSKDSRGNESTNTFTVTVTTKPPTLKVTLSPGVLWPPNHKMVTIKATIVATSDAGPVNVVLVGITSNEPDNGLGDGDTVDDIQGESPGTNDREFQVRAERSGKGKDRVYTVTYKAVLVSNPSVTTTTTATVTVPHDQSGKKK
jgi:uncharacterized repeat protein (TIGR03803 family)